jgi:putative hydrolase of the HAD superfamily
VSGIRCVVFDIDDTLFLERDYVKSGLRKVGAWVRENLGADDFFDRAWGLFEEGVRGTIINEGLERCGVEPSPDLVSTLVQIYRRHEPDISLLPDARSCLEELHGRVHLGVVSDGPLQSQRAKAHALRLGRWMDHIVFTAELEIGLGKPHPKPFQMIEEETGCSGAECAYVADNPGKDFSGPKSLGWSTVRIRRAEGLHATIDGGEHVDAELADLWSFGDVVGPADGPYVSDSASTP